MKFDEFEELCSIWLETFIWNIISRVGQTVAAAAVSYLLALRMIDVGTPFLLKPVFSNGPSIDEIVVQ